MQLSAAIDFSTADATLAVGKANSTEILFTAKKEMTGRDASSMLPWIISQIHEHGHSLDDITQLTCGAGPGSFTGLRITASLVAGLTYGKKNISARCVPSGSAITDLAESPKEKSIVLYDGRRQEIIGFSNKNKPMLTISIDNTNKLNAFDNLFAMESERKAIEKIIPKNISGQIKFLSEFPIDKLLLNKSCPWGEEKNREKLFFEPELIYIRPAV